MQESGFTVRICVAINRSMKSWNKLGIGSIFRSEKRFNFVFCQIKKYIFYVKNIFVINMNLPFEVPVMVSSSTMGKPNWIVSLPWPFIGLFEIINVFPVYKNLQQLFKSKCIKRANLSFSNIMIILPWNCPLLPAALRSFTKLTIFLTPESSNKSSYNFIPSTTLTYT